MRSLPILRSAIGLVALGWLTQAAANGQDCPHFHHAPLPAAPRTVCDAGHPFQVKDHAMRTDARHHFGYYVGGGTPFGGRGPCLNEGTYGWDYSSLSHVRLNWTRGLFQMGGGTYKAESSHPIPTIANSLLRRD